MSDPTDEQDEAEILDDDEIDLGNYPPDEPLGLADLLGRDVAVTGDYAPDSVAERSGREEPDDLVQADDEGIELIESDDLLGPDRNSELIADPAEPDPTVDASVLSDARGTGDSVPAEEAALHLVTDESDESDGSDGDQSS